MAVGAHFVNRNFPPATYEKALAELDAAGFSAPAGRLEHLALVGNDGNVVVFDVWASPEALEAFGPVLMPILTGLDVELVPPTITPVHNRISA